MIRSELDVLLDRIEDPALRADLQAQIDRLKQRRSFGLVFEQHIPERVRLHQHPIRIGSNVVSRDDDNSPTYEVIAIEDGLATLELIRDPEGAYVPRGEHPVGERERMSLDSLVVITDFGEPVLPGFRYLGAVERGGDKPYHVVINGENHHALEALRFTHAGKVDCIYIDPPYNSGARDWKYNNDYVDETDAYRHSKWLAFMERRLQLAKELLNPNESVLIVMIDQHEGSRLPLLLEQSFSGWTITSVPIVQNPRGRRGDNFSYVHELALFVMPRTGKVLSDRTLAPDEVEASNLRNWGGESRRETAANCFYPILVRDGRVVGFGESVDREITVHPKHNEPQADGSIAVWPVDPNGVERKWRYARQSVERIHDNLVVKNLTMGTLAGDVEIQIAKEAGKWKTVWIDPKFDASTYGTQLVGALLAGRAFPFPKSLYAVEECIRAAAGHKPNAIVLDFFAGSGTTAHAVLRLNKQDGGRRQSIMVTNNEVSADEATILRKQGKRPGDPDWEALGIFEHITRPRVIAAITGRTPEGEPIKGDYKFTDEFPMADGFEENAAFLELRYLDADDVDLGLGYDDIAPLLWLRAGATGPIAKGSDDAGNPLPYAWTDRYGVLFDEDRWRAFVADCPTTAAAAFIVTNSPTTFAGIVAELPTDMDTVRLYDTYLSMFQAERGRA